MPYYLERFEHVPMPHAMSEDDLGTGRVETTLVNSIAGVFDRHGDRRRLPRRHQFDHRGKYYGRVRRRITSNGNYRVTSDGNVRITAPSETADLAGQVDDLKGIIGERARLWRRRVENGERSWKRCRLLLVEHIEVSETANLVSRITSMFETDQVGWRAENATVTQASAVAGTTVGLNVPVPSALPITDATLRVARTSGTITAVRVTASGGVDFTWTGSLGAGDVLTLDGERHLAQKNGADAYAGFTLNAGHTQNYWFSLKRPLTIFLVTVTGGNANVELEFYDQQP